MRPSSCSHPLIPVDYQFCGQPVLIGGSMGTCSFVLTGTERGMAETFGSTCHGAGRAKSRAGSRRQMDYTDVLAALEKKGISIRLASPKLVMEESPEGHPMHVCTCAPLTCMACAWHAQVMEESPESYKDVTAVVETCHQAGISNKCVRLRPVGVIKG